MKSDLWLACVCFFGLPLLAVGLIALLAYQTAVATGSSPWLAVLLGIVGGTLFLGAMIASSGTDMTDFAVSSFIVIVLTIALIPVFTRARENAERRAIKQALHEHGAIYPQPQRKGAQRNR